MFNFIFDLIFLLEIPRYCGFPQIFGSLFIFVFVSRVIPFFFFALYVLAILVRIYFDLLIRIRFIFTLDSIFFFVLARLGICSHRNFFFFSQFCYDFFHESVTLNHCFCLWIIVSVSICSLDWVATVYIYVHYVWSNIVPKRCLIQVTFEYGFSWLHLCFWSMDIFITLIAIVSLYDATNMRIGLCQWVIKLWLLLIGHSSFQMRFHFRFYGHWIV